MKQEDTKQGNQQKQEYEQYVKSVTPTHNLWAQMGKAFLTGGIICCIGQGILNYTGNVLLSSVQKDRYSVSAARYSPLQDL